MHTKLLITTETHSVTQIKTLRVCKTVIRLQGQTVLYIMCGHVYTHDLLQSLSVLPPGILISKYKITSFFVSLNILVQTM